MTATAPAVGANPFLALRSFRREDAFCFFGRDADLVLVQSRLLSSRCTLLFAASGVGKSSFLDAKLAPAIESQWQIVTHRAWASGAPLPGLLASIAAKAPGAAEPGRLRSQVDRLLSAGSSTRGCLIVLDQFEEVFQHWRDSKALDEFAAEIATLVHAPGLEARVLISMREEFVGELSIFDNLIPDLFNNCYRLKNATRSEAEEIIARTAKLGGAECGDGFDPLLDDLVRSASRFAAARTSGTNADESPRSRIPMPFLQIVCYRLWREQMIGTDGSVTRTRFLDHAPGSVRQELESYCREKLQALSLPAQDLASAAFAFLMTRSGAKMAYPVDVLAQQARVDEPSLLLVLEKLSDENVRILRKVPGHDSKPWFELYHDLYARFLTDWKRERDAARELKENWKWRFVVVALLVASATTVAGIAIWRASVARDRLVAEQARASNSELADRLTRVGDSLAPYEQGLTSLRIRFALESYARVPSPSTHATLLAGLRAPAVQIAQTTLPSSGLVAMSPDGQFMALAGPDGVRLASLRDDASVTMIERPALVSALAFSPDSGTLAVAAWDGRIDLVASATGKPVKSIEIIKDGLIVAVTYSPDGKMIAAAADSYNSLQQIVQVRAIDTGSLVTTVPHGKVATALVFSPDSRYLLTGSDDGMARVVNLASGRQTVYPHRTKIIAVAISPDSRTLATSSQDGIVQVADLPAGKMTLLTTPSSAVAPALAFSPQGRYLATGQGVLWDRASRTGQSLETRGSLSALAFTPDEQIVAAAGGEGAFLLSTETRTTLVRLASEQAEMLAFGPRGDWVGITVGQTLRVFRIRSAVAREPANDAELQAMACALTTPLDALQVQAFLGLELALACVSPN